jgi:hypothetical protein
MLCSRRLTKFHSMQYSASAQIFVTTISGHIHPLLDAWYSLSSRL